MHIAFIEDTKLHGGTQLWVHNAIHYFLIKKNEITLITPEQGWLENEFHSSSLLNLVTYDYDEISTNKDNFIDIWSKALSKCEIAVCTVHPPRNKFHCAEFASKCIVQGNLEVILITKTGTIVPSYHKEYYIPTNLLNSRIITISATIDNYLKEIYKIPKSKIKFIYQGIDLNYFNHENKEIGEKNSNLTLLLSNKSPILGCIGYIENRKGQKYLIEAMKELVSKLPNIQLLIIGNGPDKIILQNLTKELMLENSITFIPFTKEIVKFYPLIDLLILPSIYKEGLPNVILEAFALKTPVIASNIGGIQEIVINDETGYLIEPKNVDQIVEAVSHLWGDVKLYRRIQKIVFEYVTTYHDRSIQFSKFEEYFRSLLKIKVHSSKG